MRFSEKHLGHDNQDHEKYAAALMRCDGYPPDCSYHGRCVRGGCFDVKREEEGLLRLLRKEAERLGYTLQKI